MRNLMRLLLFFCFTAFGLVNGQWSSVFHKKLTEQEAMRADAQNAFFFTKENVPMFTQLLYSWNALRPPRGYFTFMIQARDAHTQKWGSWHKMVDWGKETQRSYASKSDGFSKHVHVRFETEPLQLADAFRIKVVGSKGASLKSLKALAVTVVNMNKFKSEPLKAALHELQSVALGKVPKISQFALKHPESHRICSPVSCSMIAQYLSNNSFHPGNFAKMAYDKGLDTYGSWGCNMAHAFERCRGKYWFFNTRLNSFQELHKQLTRGLPVAVSVRGVLQGAPQAFPSGHLLVVVGWDKDRQEVLCHDPSIEHHHEVLKRYKIDDFLKSWEQSRRLTYWVEPASKGGLL